MIKLENIKKSFITGGVSSEVLKGINLEIKKASL